MVVALACYGAARFIPPTGVGAPGLKVHWNVFASTWRIIGEVARRRPPVGGGARHKLVLDGRHRHALARAGHHQVAHRRRNRRRDRDQPHFRPRHRRRFARRRGIVARTHRACARAVPAARHGGAGDRSRARDQRDAAGEPRGSARRILHQRLRPARRPRALPLFRRRAACSSCRSSPRSRPGRARKGAPG